MIAGRKEPNPRCTRHNPEPGMLPKIMRAWRLARRRPDRRLSEQRAHRAAEAAATKASAPMPQERAVGRRRISLPVEDALDFPHGVSRHRDQARLVELRFPDHQSVLAGVVVPHGQPRQLTPPHARRVQEHDREPHHLGAQRRIGCASPRRRGGEQLAHLAVREDMGPEDLMDGREQRGSFDCRSHRSLRASARSWTMC